LSVSQKDVLNQLIRKRICSKREKFNFSIKKRQLANCFIYLKFIRKYTPC